MSKKKTPSTGVITFHFDVPEHHIPLDQFINTAKSTQDIIENFNRELFDKKLKYDLCVVTPETGGLIELLQVIVPVVAPIWAFLSTDIGKAYIKGLTDHEPAYWAEQAGKKTRDLSDVDKQKLCAMIVIFMVLGFLQKDVADLEKTGLSKEKFRTAYVARNKVYEECIKNPKVKGLGFNASHNFPIKRGDFPSLIVKLPELSQQPETEENTLWKIDTPNLVVNSPNWKRDSKRLWQASTGEHNDIAFTIEDQNFWHHVKIRDIEPDINDNMKVQWAYPEIYSKPTKVRVLRVLTYNGKDISQPMNDKELAIELYDFKHEEKEQADLFDLAKNDPESEIKKLRNDLYGLEEDKE